MANISTLTVSLKTETAKFETGLKKARSQAEKFGKAVTAAFNVAGVATGALAVGLTALTKKSLQVVDSQTKMGRVFGRTQETMAGLALVAEVSGTSLDGLNRAMKRQTQALKFANDGLKTYTRAFDTLGVNYKDLLNLPVEQQFTRIIGALSKMENQTLKVASASEIFGTKNTDLINVISLGEEGIASLTQKVKDLGVALSTQQTDAIEKANDAVSVMKTAFTGLGNQMAAIVAPAITAVAGAIESMVGSITRGLPLFTAWLEKLTGIRRELVSLSLVELQTEFAVLSDKARELTEEVNRLAQQRDPFTGEVGTSDLFQVRSKELEELRDRLDANIARQKELANGPASVSEGTFSNRTTFSGLGNEEIQQVSFQPALLGIGGAGEEATKSVVELAQQAAAAFNATRTPLEAFKLELQFIRDELSNNQFVDAETIERSTAQAVENYQAQMKSIVDINESTVDAATEFWTQGFRSMQSSLSEFLFDPFADGLDGMVKGFATTLRKMVADLLASQLLTSFVGLFPGGSALFGLGAKSTPGSAIGGPIGANQTRLVGERGPELFTPGAKGAIRPLGSVSVNSTLNINGGNNLDAATLIPILEENNRKVKAELLDAFDRGAFV